MPSDIIRTPIPPLPKVNNRVPFGLFPYQVVAARIISVYRGYYGFPMALRGPTGFFPSSFSSSAAPPSCFHEFGKSNFISSLGLSRTKTHPRPATSSNQNMHVVNSPQGLDPALRNPRKGRVKRDTSGENEEFNREQHQNMGSPIRGHQSTPVSETIDDDNLDNDDGGGVGIDLKTRARADGQSPPIVWDDSSPGFGDLEGSGANYGHLQVGASARGSAARPKSATLTGLDEQIQDLAIQIDSFRRERKILLEFVAAQKQHQHRQWDKEGDPGVILGPCASMVSRVGDDRSEGDGPGAAVEVCSFLCSAVLRRNSLTYLSCIRKTWPFNMETIKMEIAPLESREKTHLTCLHTA